MHVLSICNHKGGVGKTMATVHIAGEFANRGMKVLVVDLDLQGDASAFFHDDPESLQWTMADIVADDTAVPLSELIQKTKYDLIDLAPGDYRLREVEIVDNYYDDQRSLVVRDMLKSLRHDYDLVLIDCPPRPYLTGFAALVASHRVLVPVPPTMQAFRSFPTLHEEIDAARQVSGLLEVSYFGSKVKRTKVSKAFSNGLKAAVNDGDVLEAKIPERASFEEAYNLSMPITSDEYRKQKKGKVKFAESVVDLVNELIPRMENNAINRFAA